MQLADYGELISYELAFFSQGITNPASGIGEAGDLSIEISSKFRALAIMALLVKGDNTLFCHNLIRSGLARRAYLRRVRAESRLEEHHFASGRYGALLDSIAAGDITLARELGNLAPSEWRQQHEYEDDYCYARIIRLLLDSAEESALPVLFLQFERYVDGAPNPRLDVSRALAARDAEAFETAFTDLLRDRQLQISADEDRGQLETPEVMAERQVFVEGLALLRVASFLGIETQREYRYCPGVARLAMAEPFPGE